MKTLNPTSRAIEDYFNIHQARYAFIINEIRSLNLPKGAKVLDVGCFPLHLFKMLKDLGFEVYGISSKHEPTREKNVASLNIETDKFPFKNNFFDLIVFTEIIEHLTLSPNSYMSKIHKALKKGGRCIVTTPNAVNLKNRIKMLFGKNVYFSLEQLYETKSAKEIYYRHNREFTLEELGVVCTNSKFKVVKKEFFSAYTPFRKGLKRGLLEQLVKTIGFFITKLSPSLQDSLCVVIVK